MTESESVAPESAASDGASEDDRDGNASVDASLDTNGDGASETIGDDHAPISAAPNLPPYRRHFLVLGVAIIGLVVGIVLVQSGRHSSPHVSPATTVVPPTTLRKGPLLVSLGAVSDLPAAQALLRSLDPETLDPKTPVTPDTAPIPSDVDLTESGIGRCSNAIDRQTTDRTLGTTLARRRLRIGTTQAFVISYAVPASGSLPKGVRVLIVDARSCRILAAVQP